MKKIITMALFVGLFFCSINNAHAIDFKAKGEWILSFDYGSGSQGASDTRHGGEVYGYGRNISTDAGYDNFNANQRVRLQLEAIASESLSGTVFFEIGDSKWGYASSGGALGADGRIIELKNAYIDWIVPNTTLKVRMGIQGIVLPSFTTEGSTVLNDDMAGIVISNRFNDNVALTAFWARIYNDNFSGNDKYSANYLDNVDMFGILLPLSFDGFNITPWALYAMGGRNAHAIANSFLPHGGALALASYDDDLYAYGNTWFLGLTGEITAADPLRIAFDFNYGASNYGEADNVIMQTGTRNFDAKREGYYGSVLFEYKLDFGTPGLYAWYSSGDDGDPYNGSERMPTISTINGHNDFSHYGGSGGKSIGREKIFGSTLIGTWGVGARIKDVSFMEDLKHTFRVNYFGGTNSTDMASDFLAQGNDLGFFVPGQGIYLTTADHAFEFGITTDYKIYENLNLNIEMAYIALHLDQDNDVWGEGFSATDAWNINASFIYRF